MASNPDRVRDEKIEEALKYARDVSSIAGVRVSDPYLVDLLEREAYGEITAEEGLELAKQHLLSQG